MRYALLLAAVPLGAFAVYLSFEIPRYTRMISNIFMSLVYSPQIEPFQPLTEGERVTILDSAGRELEILVLHRKGARKIAIFCPESGATKETWEKYAYFLPDLGYNVVSADLKLPAAEGGKNALLQWPMEADVERVVTVIRWAKKAFRSNSPIVLFGVSNGSDIAFAASFRDRAVKAVVADGLFSMKEIFRDYIRRWAPVLVKPNFFGEKFPEWIVNAFTELGFWYSQRRAKCRFVDVEKCLSRRHAPLLMIHGGKDDVIPDGHRSFLERISRHRVVTRSMVVEEAGHNQAVATDRARYEATVREFLEGIL